MELAFGRTAGAGAAVGAAPAGLGDVSFDEVAEVGHARGCDGRGLFHGVNGQGMVAGEAAPKQLAVVVHARGPGKSLGTAGRAGDNAEAELVEQHAGVRLRVLQYCSRYSDRWGGASKGLRIGRIPVADEGVVATAGLQEGACPATRVDSFSGVGS